MRTDETVRLFPILSDLSPIHDRFLVIANQIKIIVLSLIQRIDLIGYHRQKKKKKKFIIPFSISK